MYSNNKSRGNTEVQFSNFITAYSCHDNFIISNLILTCTYSFQTRNVLPQLLCKAVWFLELFSLIVNMSRGNLLHV